MKKIIILMSLLICGILSLTMMFCSAYIISWVCQGAVLKHIFFRIGWPILSIPILMIVVSSILLILDFLSE